MNFNRLLYIQKRITHIYTVKKPTRFTFRIEYLNNDQFIAHEIYPNIKSKIDLFNKNKK